MFLSLQADILPFFSFEYTSNLISFLNKRQVFGTLVFCETGPLQASLALTIVAFSGEGHFVCKC